MSEYLHGQPVEFCKIEGLWLCEMPGVPEPALAAPGSEKLCLCLKSSVVDALSGLSDAFSIRASIVPAVAMSPWYAWTLCDPTECLPFIVALLECRSTRSLLQELPRAVSMQGSWQGSCLSRALAHRQQLHRCSPCSTNTTNAPSQLAAEIHRVQLKGMATELLW